MLLFVCTENSEYKSVKVETSCTVILPPTVSVLCPNHSTCRLDVLLLPMLSVLRNVVYSQRKFSFRFRQFLKDVSKIPLSVGEFDSGESKPEVEIFEESDKINVNDFLETMMSDPGPQCLSWLLVLHR